MNAFQILKDGVSFDRQRFKRDLSLFEDLEEPETTKKPRIEEAGIQGKVVIQGENVPAACDSFPELLSSLPEGITGYIGQMYECPTLVQRYVIPAALMKREVIAVAPTGSGKTLAFLLPLVKLVKANSRLRGLILCPTKELARQIYKEALLLSESTQHRLLYIGKKSPPASDWSANYDIAISTPLICVHLLGETLLKSLRYVVFDEVDQLFELGYMEQVEAILSKCKGEKLVKWMFSATLLPAVEMLARSIMISPVKVQIGRANTTVGTVAQKLLFCSNEPGKLTALQQLLHAGSLTPPVLLFVQSKHRARALYQELLTWPIHAGLIHSDLPPAERELVVKSFRQGQTWVLICTDLMARGIDFQDVKLVLNYDFPQSVISYIHRIGRTGRRGLAGTAITFYTFEDAQYVRMVTNVMEKSGCVVPEWLHTLRNPSRKSKKALEKKPIRREKVTGGYGLSRSLRRKLHKSKAQSPAPVPDPSSSPQ